MSSESHRPPQNTHEFVALWNDIFEDHLVSQLAESLPALLRDISLDDTAHTTAVARPLVRALRRAAVSGDAAEGVRYLAETAQSGERGPLPSQPGA